MKTAKKHPHKNQMLTREEIAVMEGWLPSTFNSVVSRNRGLTVSQCSQLEKGQQRNVNRIIRNINWNAPMPIITADYEGQNLLNSLMKQGFNGDALRSEVIKRIAA